MTEQHPPVGYGPAPARLDAPGTTPRHAPSDVLALGILTIVLAAGLLVVAGALFYDGVTSDEMFAGLAVIAAVVVAAPAVVALLFTVPALRVGRRSPTVARGLGWVGLTIALSPVLLWGFLVLTQ